ncbi:MAG: HlyD family efflux transporter periplasmic adaptor subunit [Dehalococcoidia bacterium]|nr:HlyD family efflux transporter periplasmic adaptor subunit [Dehalococcoidia bacterium]
MGESGILRFLARRWWVGLLVLLVAGAAAGAFTALGGGSEAGQGDATPLTQHLVVVQRQNLITQVPLEGKLVFPATAELTFDVSGEVGELAVAPGQRVQQGQLLARLDAMSRTSLEVAVAAARLKLDQAEDNLEITSERFATTPVEKAQFEQDIAGARLAIEDAQDDLEDFLTDHDQTLALAQLSQADARLTLDAAQDNLADFDVDYRKELATSRDARAKAQTTLEKSEDAATDLIGTLGSSRTTDTDVWDHLPRLQSAVAASSATLAKATEDLARLETGPDGLKLQRLEARVTLAQTALAKTQSELDREAAGPDAAELAVKQKRMATLRRELYELLDGPESLKVALRTAEVAHAQATVADALEDLEGASIHAPFAGVVVLVNAEVDDVVTKDSRILTVVDPGQARIDGLVGAAELRLVTPGAKARVTIESLPGLELDGVVTAVAAEPRTERGVITYGVAIRIVMPPGLEAPVTPSGVGVVVLNQLNNALVVPRRAVHRALRLPAVSVLNAQGALEERNVVLGDGNGEWVTVRQGLVEGDQVAIPPETPPSSG